MTRRVLTAAFAACLVFPAAAEAQVRPAFDPMPSPGLRVTPFAGYIPGFVRQETWAFQGGGSATVTEVEMEVGDAAGGGIHLEAPLRGRFGVTALAAGFSRGETAFIVMQSGDTRRVDGANLALGRLGVAFHLPAEHSELVLRRLEASVFAGGVVLHERPRNALGTADVLGNATNFGVNLGASGGLPFGGDRFAVQLGVEDNIMFWREEPLARLPYEYFGRPGTSRSQTTASTAATHIWLLRAGFSFRFR
jgi:hypothetical protein